MRPQRRPKLEEITAFSTGRIKLSGAGLGERTGFLGSCGSGKFVSASVPFKLESAGTAGSRLATGTPISLLDGSGIGCALYVSPAIKFFSNSS